MQKQSLIALWVALSGTFTSVLAQIEPDEPLTIPHILRTPVISSFSVAPPDGKRIALSLSVVGKETIWLIPGDGTAGAPIETSKGTADRDPQWSPDGGSLAFVSNRDGVWKVHVADSNGENSHPVSTDDGEVKQPRWSPDGKSIAFLSRAAGGTSGWDLWIANANPPGNARRLTSEPFDEDDPRWSPDGERIALTLGGGRHRERRIAFVIVANGEVSELVTNESRGDRFQTRWTPDGKGLIFVSDESGRKSLFLASPASEASQEVLRSEYEITQPEFSPDGKLLAYIENREGDAKLWIHDFETGKRRTLSLRNGVHSHPLWRPDGKAVLSLFEAWNYSRDVWSYSLDGGRERESETLPPEIDVRKMARPELVRYQSSGGLEITGYLYVHDAASAENPAPLLVTPHGGPTAQWQNGWHPFTQFFVQQGYAIFAPNIRGSSGFGVEFENLNDQNWGRGDLEDVIEGAKYVLGRPEIRDERLCIWGVSYGGFLALAAISRYPDFFACAIEAVGMPDLEQLYRETTDEGKSYLEREIGPLRGNLALYRELSPLHDVGRVQTPLLSFHGEIYPLVPYSTKKAFFDALKKRPNYPLQEFIFKDEEARATYRHDLHPEASWAYVEKILAFLDVYL